ncbi:MAG: substrate-binding domain-containing protein [Patulibacter sp.]
MKKQTIRSGAATASAVVLIAVLAGCGSSSGGSTEDVAETQGSGAAKAPANARVQLGEAAPIARKFSAEIAAEYGGYDGELSKSPYADFKAAKGPWKLCYSESFQGNPWRVALTKQMKRIVGRYQKAGLLSDFSMSVSDGDLARENQQIRQFADQGCSIILALVGSPTGLNAAIKSAHDKGVPVLTLGGTATSPYAQNVDSNFRRVGAQMAANATAGADGGSILMVKGIQGITAAEQQNEGAKEQWKKDGAKITAEVYGNWAPAPTKQAVLRALATNPAKIPSVWTTGSETPVIAEAFKQGGRPVPAITGSISGDALGYWNQNKDTFKFNGYGQLPSWTAETAVRVAMRMLNGNGPKINTMLVPMPLVTQADLPGLYESCMTPNSSDVFPVLENDPLPTGQMDEYFEEKGEVGPYDYSDIPRACDGAGTAR